MLQGIFCTLDCMEGLFVLQRVQQGFQFTDHLGIGLLRVGKTLRCEFGNAFVQFVQLTTFEGLTQQTDLLAILQSRDQSFKAE